MKINLSKMEQTLRLIVRAIEKGAGEDVRDYLNSTDKATNNAVRLMRADNINTNLRNSVMSEAVQLKYFKRYGWTGCLLIDRENKVTFTICTEKTLAAIPRKLDRRIPHYLQTILYVQNAGVKPMYEQEELPAFGYGQQMSMFSDEEFRQDYESIMDDELTFDDGYVHYVIAYEVDHYDIVSISLRLLDKDFRKAQEYPLDALLQPDFSELTSEQRKTDQKDAHSLVSVKAGLGKPEGSQQEPVITPKIIREKRQA